MSVLSFGWGNLKLSFNTNERSDFKFEKRSRQGDTGLNFSSMTTVYSQLRWNLEQESFSLSRGSNDLLQL